MLHILLAGFAFSGETQCGNPGCGLSHTHGLLLPQPPQNQGGLALLNLRSKMRKEERMAFRPGEGVRAIVLLKVIKGLYLEALKQNPQGQERRLCQVSSAMAIGETANL